MKTSDLTLRDRTLQGVKMEGAMKRRNFALRGAAIVALASALIAPSIISAQTMDQYYVVPPFVSDQVLPNIILVLDNSGSMSGLTCDRNDNGDCVNAGDLAFSSATSFAGYFDNLTCYTYDTADTRFEPSTTKVAVSPLSAMEMACGSTEWDGNFLNWATFRRFDALKKAMTGGDCFVARAADGTCPTNGTPALKTIRAQASGVNVELASVPIATLTGRIPAADRAAGPATVYIGTDAAYFCVDNDNSFNTDCGDGYSQRKYWLKIGYTTEPTGVIQQIGAQARFGLFEFKPTGDGARMLVGVGSRQSIDFSGSTVETFNTNVAAMVDAVGESFPSTWTPLSESIYETTRYIAQINSTYQIGRAHV